MLFVACSLFAIMLVVYVVLSTLASSSFCKVIIDGYVCSLEKDTSYRYFYYLQYEPPITRIY